MAEEFHIRGLIEGKLAGRKIDPVGCIDALLDVAKQAGNVKCSLASDHSLRVKIGAQSYAIELEAAQAKLRLLCARLSVLCSETIGADISPYGGEGTVRSAVTPSDQWSVCFKNTPGEQEFAIVRLSTSSPPTSPRHATARPATRAG